MNSSKHRLLGSNCDDFATEYDQWDSEHRSVEKQRSALVRGLKGRILEVGIGTGINLRYYPAGADVTGVDISHGMLRKAFLRLKPLKGHHIKLVCAPAELLPFVDGMFDAVVGTFVFCSFSDPEAAAAEIKRVLGPGGCLVTLGYHTPMVAKILLRTGFVIGSQQEWETDERAIGQIVAEHGVLRSTRRNLHEKRGAFGKTALNR